MSTPVEHLRNEPQRERTAPLRFVTAASLFDGHDAAINIIRRLLQAQGAEVIHLGHNRSVAEVVNAALQEDADGIAVSSYQGGHVEYFKYMVDILKEKDAGHIAVVVGGGGTIAPAEIADLEAYGVEKIYTPEDGMRMGLDGMIADVFHRVRARVRPAFKPGPLSPAKPQQVARSITMLESAVAAPERLEALRKTWAATPNKPLVVGITGTGGAGKSSLTDELLNRFMRHFPDRNVAVLAVDPTRRRTGGALLGDRIRMNSLKNERIYMRSIATRRQHLATSAVLSDSVQLLKFAGYDLIILETAGIGQSDTEVVDLVDISLYVMTSDYGAASQLEKIDMLDFADLVALNKFEKRGAEDALRDVRKQWKRNRLEFRMADEQVPVFPTIASQFNDPGVNRLFARLCRLLCEKGSDSSPDWGVQDPGRTDGHGRSAIIPPARSRYLAEIAESARAVTEDIQREANAASLAHGCYRALRALSDPVLPAALKDYDEAGLRAEGDASLQALRRQYNESMAALSDRSRKLLREWPERVKATRADRYTYQVRGREISGDNYFETLSHQRVPKLALPALSDWGDQLRFLREENLPGGYPYTAGVYPYRRELEDPTRMFAGEGTPERTNRRFHYLSAGHPATRLSTAFDSVTLYGEDPDPRPDIYGRVGNSGVSIATLDDMKKLYSGFDLCAPNTSVSMTINGPAPMILAMFMNAAIDQQVERHLREQGRWPEAEKKIAALFGTGRVRSMTANCPLATKASGWDCWASAAISCLTRKPTNASLPGRSARCAAPCRQISSRKIRHRTPASFPPSLRCA